MHADYTTTSPISLMQRMSPRKKLSKVLSKSLFRRSNRESPKSETSVVLEDNNPEQKGTANAASFSASPIGPCLNLTPQSDVSQVTSVAAKDDIDTAELTKEHSGFWWGATILNLTGNDIIITSASEKVGEVVINKGDNEDDKNVEQVPWDEQKGKTNEEIKLEGATVELIVAEIKAKKETVDLIVAACFAENLCNDQQEDIFDWVGSDDLPSKCSLITKSRSRTLSSTGTHTSMSSDPFSKLDIHDDIPGSIITNQSTIASMTNHTGSKLHFSSKGTISLGDTLLDESQHSEHDFDQLLGTLKVNNNGDYVGSEVDSANPFGEEFESTTSTALIGEEFLSDEDVKVVYCERDDTSKAQPIFEVMYMEQDTERENTMSRDSEATSCSSGASEITHNTNDNIGPAEEPEGVAMDIFATRLAALILQESELGECAEVADSYNALGNLYYRKDHCNAAVKCHVEALRIQRMITPHNNQARMEVTKTLNNIGEVCFKMDEYILAMDIHQKVLELLKKEVVAENEEAHSRNAVISQTLMHIGAVYYRVRNSLSAIRAKNNLYSGFLKTGMLNLIALAYSECGFYRMAIAIYEEQLQLLLCRGGSCVARKGAAVTARNLGNLCCQTGCYPAALDYHELALELEQKLVPPPPQSAEVLDLKGTALFHLGELEKAKVLFQDSLELRESRVGNQHKSITTTLRHVGIVQRELYECDSAMMVFERALKIQKMHTSVNHPSSLLIRLEIARTLTKQFRLEEASEQLADILELQIKVHGKRHPTVADILESIGIIQALKGDLYEALESFQQCFFTREKFLGIGHPLVANVLHHLATVNMQKGFYYKSLRAIVNVIVIRKDALGEDHIDVGTALMTKGKSLIALGKIKKAEKYLNHALQITRLAGGASHPAVADVLTALGKLYLQKCEYCEAHVHLREALDIYGVYQVNEAHPNVVLAKNTLSRVENESSLLV